MSKKFSKRLCALFIFAGLLSLSDLVMSLYSVSTANWCWIDSYRIGLFQTCSPTQCSKNQYTENFNENGTSTNTTLVFSRRLFNAGPLAIVSILIQLLASFHCFISSYIHLPCKWPSTAYITPFLVLIAFLFQYTTMIEASHGIFLNGDSARVFHAATVLLVATLTLTAIGADRIYQLTGVEYV